MARSGHHGRILRVDLASGTTRPEEVDDDTSRLYAGGSLLATRLLLRETPAGLDAFDPANLLVFASSVIAGHRAAGLPRFSVIAKSPLTGGIGEARAEGPWGVALKESGYDAIVIGGRADRPVILVVADGEARIEDAGALWGLETGAATDAVTRRLPGSHVAAIGPAGERLVRYASIVSDRSFAAPRMGLGAVMGAKRLKAIVLAGGTAPPLADPAAVAAITSSYAGSVLDNPLTRWQKQPPGFGAWIDGATPGTFAVENYRTARFDGAGAFEADAFLRALAWSDGGCPGCPNDCVKGFAARAAADPGARDAARRLRAGGLHQEAAGSLGPNLGVADLDVVLELNRRCLELGLDPVSLGFTLSFVMECRDRGLLGPADLDGLDLRFGGTAHLLPAVDRIARREGVGDRLADGVRRLAAAVGPASDPFALHVKGLEVPCFDPRTMTNLGLGYATAAIGPRYDICEHDVDFDPEPSWPHTLDQSRTLGILGPLPTARLSPEKVRAFRVLSDLWSAFDALNLCIFAGAPTRILSLDAVTGLVRAVTGWETSGYEVMRWGQRRNHLLRIYNLREGLTAADDRLPDRFFDLPIDTGRFEGVALDRRAFGDSIAGYYASMGWSADGVPTEATRWDQHLEWALAPGGDAP